MTDLIRIEGLHLRTIIGINGDERRDRQDIMISLALHVDTSKAGRTDDIVDAPFNYRTLTKRIIAMVEGTEFMLLERLAEVIAGLCLEEKAIVKVKVAVDKPGALRFARSVGVTIERERSGG